MKESTKPTKVHKHCVFLNKDKLHVMLARTYIWDNYIKYIMQCNNEVTPSKMDALQYVIKEITNLIRVMPSNPMCKELKLIVQNRTI